MRQTCTTQSTYPDGQLSAQVHFSKGKLDGISRYWHPNGVLACQTPMKAGLRHGICRQWNAQGQLLGSFRMNMGTGVMRYWYPNGRLQYEINMVKGLPHGRQRLWSEQGELVAESFYVKGKSVSFERYQREREKHPDLPAYASESVRQEASVPPKDSP